MSPLTGTPECVIITDFDRVCTCAVNDLLSFILRKYPGRERCLMIGVTMGETLLLTGLWRYTGVVLAGDELNSMCGSFLRAE